MENSRSRAGHRLNSSDGLRWQIGLAENLSKCAPSLYSRGTRTETARVQEAVSQRDGRRLRLPKPDWQDADPILKSSQPLASSDLQAARDNPNHLALTAPLVWDGIGRERSSAQDAARTDGAREHRDDDEVLRSCSREIVSRGRTCHRPRHGSTGEKRGGRTEFGKF